MSNFKIKGNIEVTEGQITIDGEQIGVSTPTYLVNSLQIDTNNWVLENDFFYKDVTLNGVLSTSYLTVIPNNLSLEIVKTAELSPLIEVNEDSFRIYAKTIPTATIDVFVVLFNN
jgi:ABC-type transport system involved in Fe-S cluster assembly fused permease/ATPase subunit